MKSKLTLYEDSQILIDKNLKVDSLSTYLATLTKKVFSDLNYIEPRRELSLKIELSQTNLDMGTDNSHNYNYALLETDNVEYFYFITDYKWTSVSVISISLYMDTINTFTFKNQGEAGSVDYVITPKTLIHRQHKDRWLYDDELTIVPLTPIIDKMNEGINPLMYKIRDEVISEEKLLLAQKWYLVYENANAIVESDFNQVNPVNIMIAPEKSTRVATNGQINLTPAMVEVGFTDITSYIQDDRNEAIEVDIAGATTIIESYFGYQGVNAGNKYIWIQIYKANAADITFTIYVKQTIISATGSILYSSTISTYSGISAIDLFNPPSKLRAYYSQYGLSNFPTTYNKTFSPLYAYGTAFGIDSLDRTESKLIKVIELPYCPLDVDYDLSSDKELVFKKNIKLDDDNDFITLVNNRYGLAQKRGAFKHTISVRGNILPWNLISAVDTCLDEELYSDSFRNIRMESKLYNSEFYQTKLVYDSFNMNIDFDKLEMYSTLMQFYDEANEDIILSMFTPTTIVSKFGFNINLTPNSEVEDYPLFLSIARNNELPIYSSQYINYVRNGFNYDIKAKNQQAMSSGVGVGLATLGAVAGIGLGIASNNPAIAVGAVISAITSVTAATTSAINSAISNQRAIEQKLAQAKAQAVSVQGNDDIDLLDVYTNDNKVKVCHYQPSQAMLNNIFDLFFYTGYAVEKLGLPDWTSRMRFNYVSADIDMLTIKHLPKDIVDDIKARWSLGITFMHRLTSDITQRNYDFEQEFENWEWTLEDALTITQP